MALTRTYRITPDGERIDGVYLKAFINNARYFLTDIAIYRDGLIDCWEWVDFAGFKRKVRSGWVVTQLPTNANVRITPLGAFTVADASYEIDPEEFIKEVADEIDGLNSRPTTSDRCRAAWAAYQASPSDASKRALRVTYEAIPKHNRDYVLANMDTNDRPIRTVLYPDVELCRLAWVHYQARPIEQNKEALRVAYEALSEDKRRDAVSNLHTDDRLIRAALYPG